ncbi:MAG TPA: 16S rRNA (guanine(527)-N(7))-methyltransferase RsmG [Stellaceae bacterium]|nr:16S rRNA (guanine(527)-N(7))-methyltransferase RsmG [Stellaceae bacterium]
MGPEGFARLCPVSRETLAQLAAYAELLYRWSGHINLVGRGTLDDPWRRHFLDSAQLYPLVPAGTRALLDLGSGAGFPGLVLAILGVESVTLADSDSRKCAFLREAARVTGTKVAIHAGRIETLPPHPFEVVTARALAPLDRLLALAEPFLGPDTSCLFLKGERAAEELTRARKGWKMEAAVHPSRSDPRGVILELQQVVREPRDF